MAKKPSLNSKVSKVFNKKVYEGVVTEIHDDDDGVTVTVCFFDGDQET